MKIEMTIQSLEAIVNDGSKLTFYGWRSFQRVLDELDNLHAEVAHDAITPARHEREVAQLRKRFNILIKQYQKDLFGDEPFNPCSRDDLAQQQANDEAYLNNLPDWDEVPF